VGDGWVKGGEVACLQKEQVDEVRVKLLEFVLSPWYNHWLQASGQDRGLVMARMKQFTEVVLRSKDHMHECYGTARRVRYLGQNRTSV
jgi:hypothetical protein